MADTQKDLHPEVRNLAFKYKDSLSDIASHVIDTWKADRESRSEWEAMHAQWLRLYYQKDKPKNPPWEGASDESLPLLAEGCTQFSARAYKAMFPGQQIIRCVPTGQATAEDKARAERVGRHMSHQLMVKDKTYKRNKDRLLLSLPLHGHFFTKTFYDPTIKRNVVRNVRATDLIVPYGTGPREVDDLSRKTEMVWKPMHECRRLVKAGYFIEEPEPYKASDKKPDDEALKVVEGVTESPLDPDPPALLLEQHLYWDLEEDGTADPYIATVCAQSQKVLRLTIRWETDDSGKETDDRRPVEYYTSYSYMENPDGFYGLGQGHLIAQANIAVNKLLRQTIDAATLANVGNHSGFISEQLAGVSGGELAMKLGKYVKVPASAEDMKNGIFQMKYPGPSNVLPAIIELITARSDRLATIPEVLAGQTEKVMQPTTVMALIEQALQPFTAVYERVTESWTRELEKIYRLNFKHLDEKEYFSLHDVDGVLRNYAAGKSDYTPDLQVTPIADPRLATEQQKLAKAETVYKIMMSNPLVLNSPQHIFINTKRMLEAIGADNTEELLPNPSSQLPRVDDPYQENFFAMQSTPMMPMAFPDQDHMSHMKAHGEAMIHPSISEFGRHLIEEHIKAHGRLADRAVRSPGLATESDNSMGLAGLGQEVPAGMDQAGVLDGGAGPESLALTGTGGSETPSAQPAQPV